MNIQQYYEQAATVSLNGSLVAFIPTLTLVIFAFVTHTYHLVLLILPFLIYSFFCYQKFLLNQKYSKAVNLLTLPEDQQASNLFSEKQLLLTFLPAPSLRLLLFAESGIKVGEIRDYSFSPTRWILPSIMDRICVRKFGLFDQKGELIVIYHFYKDRIELSNEEGEVISKLVKIKNEKKDTFMLENLRITIKKSSLQTDINLEDADGNKVAQINTGWMPLEWGKRFVQLNTPILEFDNNCTDHDRVQLFSLLVSIYAYSNH
jgi:hypothetical protein